MSKTLLMSVGGLTVLGCVVGSFVTAQVTQIPVRPGTDRETPEQDTQILMQAKLASAQKVLKGLVTQDFEEIESAASVLSRISLTPPPHLSNAGDQTDEQVYEHFRMEFARLAGELERHARRQELEATAWVQQNLTATCIACHDYIRDNP